MTNPQLLCCMHDAAAPASGGLASVHWLPDVLPVDLDNVAATLRDSAESSHATVCMTRDGEQYIAESYSPGGRPIQFCGHGALAAAWIAFNDHETAVPELSFANRQHHWQARRIDSDVADIALTFTRPAPVDCDVPDYAEVCVGRKPIAAAVVGGDTDYLILELANAAALQAVEPDSIAISGASRRAFIVTARADGDTPACVFRYFAPQYGTPEDTATGSAAVQLAAYWAPRLNTARFAARQLSAQGAMMQLSCHSDVVELAARVGYG